MNLGLDGQVALITGGASDVGREIALGLSAEGAAVIVNYHHSRDAAERLVEEIKSYGGLAYSYCADVSDYATAHDMIESIVKCLGHIDVVVNNAGLAIRRHFEDTSPSDWTQQIGIGLYGVLNTSHAALPYMREQQSGRLINLAGDSARVGESGLSVTAAARGGVLAFTKSLAREIGRFNITANVVSLGLVKTTHIDAAWLEKHYKKIIPMYPLRRLGSPFDIAPTVIFLSSQSASWITGQVISVNGGFCMP